MNILLVYPEMPDTFYAMRHLNKVLGKKTAYPPLGLLTIASLLPDNWNAKLRDVNAAPLSDKDLDWADFIFLSAMNVQEKSVREIVAQCKSLGVKIVAGGPLFTHEYDRFSEVDHFVLNEAEVTLPMFLEDLEKNDLKRIYTSNEFADVSQTPIPSFHLANMDDYLYSIVQYSRGCPYMCDFCDVTALFGRRPRIKKSDQIIRELEAIEKQGNVKLILFADDNLMGNKRSLKNDLLPALINWRKKRNPGFFFATQITINLADDDELMKLMIDAGFRHIFIGIETPDENALLESMKKQNLKRNQLENVLKLHNTGFIISGGFIVGFDTDTSSIFQQQIDFIQKSGIPLPIVNILKAPPGTELFDRMEREGRLIKQFAFGEGETNVKPVMPEHELYQGFIKVISEIYEPDKSYQRLMNFFNSYKGPKTDVKVPDTYNLNDLRMIFRIVFLLGLKDENRKYFWKLIFWVFKNHRKHLDKAVFYGSMMYQMNQTYKYIKSETEKELREIENQPAHKVAV